MHNRSLPQPQPGRVIFRCVELVFQAYTGDRSELGGKDLCMQEVEGD